MNRIKAVLAARSAPPSLDLKADLKGRLDFHLVFDDSEHGSIEGQEFMLQGRLGKNQICFVWDVHMKEARTFLDARAAFETAQLQRTGERASLQARFEAAIHVGEDEAKALAKRNAAEDALTQQEKSERLALNEIEAEAKAGAAAMAAAVEEEFASMVEQAEAKRIRQEKMLPEACEFEESEAEARAEAKALKQAEKTLKRAEKQAEAEKSSAEESAEEDTEDVPKQAPEVPPKEATDQSAEESTEAGAEESTEEQSDEARSK